MKLHVGYYQAFAVYFIWGVFPVYWKYLKEVEAFEILSHRILWSFVFLGLVSYLFKKTNAKQYIHILKNNFKMIFLLAGLIATNWIVYVYAVNTNQILQGSLAYFMTPLINITLGSFLFKEHLSKQMKLAAGIAALGVSFLIIANNSFPWIALSLAFSFSFYGVVKKKIKVEGLESSLLESFVMLIPAVITALMIRASAETSLQTHSWILLVLSGAVTATPILLFSLSARSIPFNHIGILQFLAPTLQFIIGYFMYNEEVSQPKMVAFLLVWIGVGLYLQQILKKRSI